MDEKRAGVDFEGPRGDLYPGSRNVRHTADPTGISVGNESGFSSASPNSNGNILDDDGGTMERMEAKLWPAPSAKTGHLSI